MAARLLSLHTADIDGGGVEASVVVVTAAVAAVATMKLDAVGQQLETLSPKLFYRQSVLSTDFGLVHVLHLLSHTRFVCLCARHSRR